jgi:hypothetical protein
MAVMKRRLRCAGLLLALLAVGCARMPSTISPIGAPTRQLIVHLTLSAPVDARYYYFIAIDNSGSTNEGPVPIVANPSAPIPATGVPLIISNSTLPPQFYLQYHQPSFFEYRNLQFIGPPYYGALSQDGRTIGVIMDLDQITTTASTITLNIITSDRLIPPESQFIQLVYDGLGPSGNSYLIIPIDVNGAYSNADAAVPEREGDTSVAAIDIADWSVEVRLTGP